MNILIFGATGMVGQGVLRECLLATDVALVQAVGRTPTSKQDAKLRDVVVPDLFNVQAYADRLGGFDACFFCLGVSSAGMKEDAYTRLTYDLTLQIATVLAERNPRMTFVYVSGAGTDSSEQGRSMWARVKGRTENSLLGLPFRAAYMFRPGFIAPMHGIRSKTKMYQLLYTVLKPITPVLHALLPNQILTTEEVGKAMLIVSRNALRGGGSEKSILEVHDIRSLLSSKK
jgi:uncharacterized protein YbjT (DUF2867 family)